MTQHSSHYDCNHTFIRKFPRKSMFPKKFQICLPFITSTHTSFYMKKIYFACIISTFYQIETDIFLYAEDILCMYFVLTNISEVIWQASGKVHLDWKSVTYISENGYNRYVRAMRPNVGYQSRVYQRHTLVPIKLFR